MAVNPFVWGRPIDDSSKTTGREGFARDVALTLKGQTNVAIFGPRDTGKTTFAFQLARELAVDHGPDAPPHTVVRINLQRAFSIPAFIAAVHDGLTQHSEKRIRREARRQLGVLEKEIGFDIKVIKGAVKRSGVTAEQDSEALHAQLASLAKLDDHLVIIFDEFQRLNRCPQEPLAIIRSALMSGTANHVSLVFTGSIREALRMMLERSTEPIFGEAAQMQLPAIDPVEFLEFLEFNFEATGRPAEESALEHLVEMTRCHPKRTQQLAWSIWKSATRSTLPISVDLVQSVYARMLTDPSETSEFSVTLDMLANGDDAQTNEMRALFLLADRADNVTGRGNLALYGFTSRSRITAALERLRRRGLVEHLEGSWQIVDPVFADWLRAQSPLGLRSGDF